MALTGCSNQRFVAIGYPDSKSLDFYIPRCGNERLHELLAENVSNDDHPIVLWRLREPSRVVPT